MMKKYVIVILLIVTLGEGLTVLWTNIESVSLVNQNHKSFS